MEIAVARQSPQGGVAVVVVPFLAQSHLNLLLDLSLRLSGRGLPVHYATTATHVRQVKSRIQGWEWDAASAGNIHFHELPIAPFASPPPARRPGAKFPPQNEQLFRALEHLRPPLASLLRSISTSCSRLVVIHDPLVAFAAVDASSLPNAEAYTFNCISATSQLVFDRALEGKPVEDVLNVLGVAAAPSVAESVDMTVGLRLFFDGHWDQNYENPGMLFNSCRPVEGEILDLIAQEPRRLNKKIFAVAPLSPALIRKEPGRPGGHECLRWLDKQPPASVVYVSFGSSTTMTGEQVEQLAVGLQRSGQRFLWVLRNPDLADIFSEDGRSHPVNDLPQDYEKNVEGTGIVVRDWAPQLEVLAHPSTAAFVSHCGWNSCLESLGSGVPMIAWPMHSDQPMCAALVADYLKAGVTVSGWERSGEVVDAGVIEESIERLMASDEGKEIRARAKVVGDAIQAAAAEGGSSRSDFDAFVHHITR